MWFGIGSGSCSLIQEIIQSWGGRLGGGDWLLYTEEVIAISLSVILRKACSGSPEVKIILLYTLCISEGLSVPTKPHNRQFLPLHIGVSQRGPKLITGIYCLASPDNLHDRSIEVSTALGKKEKGAEGGDQERP